jgi:hypothetical protein
LFEASDEKNPLLEVGVHSEADHPFSVEENQQREPL